MKNVENSVWSAKKKIYIVESGLEYLPPSNFLLNVLDNTKPGTSMGSPVSKVFEEEENLMKKLEGYSNMMVSTDIFTKNHKKINIGRYHEIDLNCNDLKEKKQQKLIAEKLTSR